jgi:hypothetical protein
MKRFMRLKKIIKGEKHHHRHMISFHTHVHGKIDFEILSDFHVLSLREYEKWFLVRPLSVCVYGYAQT